MTRLIPCIISLSAALFAAGCSTNSDPAKPNASAASPTKSDGDHAHKASERGGILVPIGSDKYHAEAVFEKGGKLRLFTLGQNEAQVLEVEVQELAASVRVAGDTVWEDRRSTVACRACRRGSRRRGRRRGRTVAALCDRRTS